MTLSNDADAWKCLPPAAQGGGQPLPAWARATAKSLPYTTAATLELDRIYRTSEALDPKLAAAIRLAVARALRSEYGRAYAVSDLRRLGVDPDAIGRIEGDRGSLPEGERAVLDFAERMTLAGDSATDAEVAGLVAAHGEEKVVAIVLQIAYANFLDRMALALGLAVEPGGPVPPVAVRYARPDKPGIPPAPRPPAPADVEAPAAPEAADPEWTRMGYPQLQERLEAQRGRKPRVSIPSWDEFRATLPAGIYPVSRQLRIRWSLLVSGRQPALGTAWINCLRVFEAEAAQDRVFEESLFWVVTRSLRCFYCMGHCEMLLGVAGLDPGQIADRTAKLASGDWSGFPPAERIAFAFARKLTRAPWDISEADIRRLGDAFGPERALDVIWWSSRCQFMTKVSDAFQLQLERENVFVDHLKPDEGPK
ncbi:carboxymuconolactone decarboxylase family protein [Tundrisphaera sp. TA3]|uniref:carboxymuconolactone decarboxylase family protein n=1 Tax=Tundrisphaera sp. TA3 TaxID=3435775 RepID=UPI003EBD6FB6